MSLAPLLPAHISVLFVLLDHIPPQHSGSQKQLSLGLRTRRPPFFGASCLVTSLIIPPFSAQLSALDLSIVLGIRIASLRGVSSLGRRFGVGSLHFRSSGPVLFFFLCLTISYQTLYSQRLNHSSHGAEYVRLLRLATMGHPLYRTRAFLPGLQGSQANTDHTPVYRKQQWGPHMGHPRVSRHQFLYDISTNDNLPKAT